jgi:hypothetical protein
MLPPPRHKFDFSPRQFVPQFLRRSWQTVDANALIAKHFFLQRAVFAYLPLT